MALRLWLQARCLCCGGEGDGEEVVGVLEGVGGGETGGVEEAGDGRWGELVAVLGVDGLAGGEVEGEGGAGGVGGDVHLLLDQRFEVHLDAGLGDVPAGDVAETGGLEVGVEVAVEAGEDVAVEGGGDSLGVVVGVEEGGDRFVGAGGQVGAEEEGVAGVELGAEVGEDALGFGGGEVADAGADVEGQDLVVGGALEGDGVGDVVGDLGVDVDAGDRLLEGLSLLETAGADVDGLVEDAVLGGGGGSEEDAGLGGGSGSQFGDGDGGVEVGEDIARVDR